MFNHECSQRRGEVVGACMDGFLFGACCQLPSGSAGELVESDSVTLGSVSNDISKRPTTMDVMTNGMSQIAQSLLNSAMPTAHDNGVYQVGGQDHFVTSGITYSDNTEVDVVHQSQGSDVSTDELRPSTVPSVLEDRKTTVRNDETTPYVPELPLIQISISNAPVYSTPTYGKPIFRPKPQKPSDADKYVLVPTITYTSKPNITESESTTRKPPTTSYVYNSTPISSKKPPSTSYVYSPTPPATRPTTNKKPQSQTTEHLYTYPTSRPTTEDYKRPTLHSTFANSPAAFVTSNKPTRTPPSTITAHVPGPGFSVSSTPVQVTGAPSPPPTVIVLGPIEETTSTTPSYPTRRPITYSTPAPSRKPITQLTINNHITQNIYSTIRPPTPTVLITPKPSTPTRSPVRKPTTEAVVAPSEQQTSADDLINFPPVRNPNLNVSSAVLEEFDATTPVFLEDPALDQKVESFVNKIIEGLQEPFQDLKDVVYNNKTTTTTGKPAKKPSTTTKKPATKPPSNTKPPTRRPTASTTKKPSTTTKKRATTRRPTTTTESYIEEEESSPPTTPGGDYRTRKSFLSRPTSRSNVPFQNAAFGLCSNPEGSSEAKEQPSASSPGKFWSASPPGWVSSPRTSAAAS